MENNNNDNNRNNNNNNVVNNNPYASAYADTTRSRFRSLKPSARVPPVDRSTRLIARTMYLPHDLRRGSSHQPRLHSLYVRTVCNNRVKRICRLFTVYVSDFDTFLMHVVQATLFFIRTRILSTRYNSYFDTLDCALHPSTGTVV